MPALGQIPLAIHRLPQAIENPPEPAIIRRNRRLMAQNHRLTAQANAIQRPIRQQQRMRIFEPHNLTRDRRAARRPQMHHRPNGERASEPCNLHQQPKHLRHAAIHGVLRDVGYRSDSLVG